MARLAALPAAHVGRTAVGIGKRIGGRPAEAVAAQVQQRTAEQLFATLGQLKGGAMKVGQAMSAMEAALPEQLVGPYREALVRLQEAAPAMPASLVDEQLERSLGEGWQWLFLDFDDRPVAAASVGQVHRAIWSDGTPVAVKVQYRAPGRPWSPTWGCWLRTSAYRFTRAWLQDQTRRASDPFGAAARTQRRLTVPPRHLLLQRVATGLVGVLCSLDATVAVDDEVRRWLPGYGEAPRRRCRSAG
jgi:hypothetical protein